MPEWINPRIDLGNVLTVLGVVVALVVNWSVLGADVQLLKRQTEALQAADVAFDQRLTVFKEKMADVQLEQTKTLGDIRADIRSIREALERINPDNKK